jgi:hypothetical protein
MMMIKMASRPQQKKQAGFGNYLAPYLIVIATDIAATGVFGSLSYWNNERH